MKENSPPGCREDDEHQIKNQYWKAKIESQNVFMWRLHKETKSEGN